MLAITDLFLLQQLSPSYMGVDFILHFTTFCHY